MVGRARNFSRLTGVKLIVVYDGCPREEIQRLYGRDFSYRPQVAGDLGQRLLAALADSLGKGAGQVVLIGSDCPEITEITLNTAFSRLTDHDLVLGPARDGGYYLIGLKAPHPEIFQDISWGSAEVLSQTLAQGKRLNLKTVLLEALTDIDRPEDLPVWEALPRWGRDD